MELTFGPKLEVWFLKPSGVFSWVGTTKIWQDSVSTSITLNLGHGLRCKPLIFTIMLLTNMNTQISKFLWSWTLVYTLLAIVYTRVQDQKNSIKLAILLVKGKNWDLRMFTLGYATKVLKIKVLQMYHHLLAKSRQFPLKKTLVLVWEPIFLTP